MVSLDSTPHIVPNRLVIPLPLSSRRKATSSALRVEMTSASNGAEYRCFITDANGDMGSTRVATVKLDTRDWQMEYNTSGLRTRRISDDKTYSYIYAGDKLMRMTVGDDILDFSYDANGAPLTMTCNGTVYYYITNLQGDVMKLERADGGSGAQYAYDAWGNIIAMSGTLAELNPLRYRGYVYDQETGFYYVSSRYYDPEVGRWINADSFATTGEGVLSCNMFAYCYNDPVNKGDSDGHEPITLTLLAVYAIAALVCTVIVVKGVKVISAIRNNSKTDQPESKGKNQKKKPVNLPSWKKIRLDTDHIFSGHMPDGPRNPNGNKTIFWGLTASQVVKLIHEAYNHSSVLATVGERIKLIGYSSTFNMVIEIWLNVAEKVIESAYPKG